MVRDPIAAAGKVTTRAQAERLTAQLEADLDQRSDLPPGYEQQANEAIHTLLQRDFSKPAKGKPSTNQRRPPMRKPGQRRTTRARGRGASGGRQSLRRRAAEQTGLPAAGRTATSFGLGLVGVMIGLGLLYLLLTNTERAGSGRSALDVILGAVAGTVRAVIAPVDPLAHGAYRASSLSTSEQRILAGEAAGPPAPSNVVQLRPRRPVAAPAQTATP